MRSSKLFNEEGKGCGSPENATNRDALIEWQEKRLREKNQMYLDQSIPKYYCPPRHGVGNHCRVPLYEDYEADINSLVVFKNIRSREKYFIGRTVTHSFYQFAVVSTIVENWDGARALRLYIVQEGMNPMFIPAGLIVILTQPRVRQMYNGNYILWCTDPLDIHFLDELGCKRIFPHFEWKSKIPAQFEHTRNKAYTAIFSTLMYYVDKSKNPKYKLMEQIIKKGNEFFFKAKYIDALECYQKVHNIAGNDVNILVSRSMVLHKLRCFSLAYEDASHALKFEPLFIKAILCKAKAMAAMNRFPYALEFLKFYASTFLENKQGKASIEELKKEELRISKMMKDHDTGDYDMPSLVSHTYEQFEDYGEYLGPLQIKHFPGKGRGVITTKEIKAGELILATRTYERVSFASECSQRFGETGPGPTTELQRQEFFTNCAEKLAEGIMRHLAAEPHTKKDVLSLYAGPQLKYLNRDDVKRDTEVSPHRIKKIVQYNTFMYQYSGGPEVDDRPRGIGLWVQPSLINHSCMDCNCFWKVYGDFVFIRAFKDVPAGEEILIPYFNPCSNYLSRKLEMENLGINCECVLCRMEKTISKSDLRKKLEIMERYKQQKTAGELRTQKLRKDIEAIKRMYKNQKYNLDLISIRKQSAAYFLGQGNVDRAIEDLKSAHSLTIGTCLCESAVNFAANIVWLFLKYKKDTKNGQKWVNVLQRDLITAYGMNEVMGSIDRYKATLEEMNKNGLQFR